MDYSPFLSYSHDGFYGIIGVAQVDITPPLHICMNNWGASDRYQPTGIHAPLMMSVATFRSFERDDHLVLISVDLGFWKRVDDEAFVRGEVLKSLGLEEAQLMFCLSHTHAGPSLCREEASMAGGQYIEPYLRFVTNAAISCVNKALSAARPAIVSWDVGACRLAKNRDLPLETDQSYAVGFNPYAPADDTLLIGRISDEEGALLGTVVNYACHPTTLAWENSLLSPDYVGELRRMVETETGAPLLFLQGASGELAPAEQYAGDCALADRHGKQLGHAVLSVLAGMLPPNKMLSFGRVVESGARLAIWDQVRYDAPRTLAFSLERVDLPLKDGLPIQAIEQEWMASTDPVLKERLWRKLSLRKSIVNSSSFSICVWVWRLGNLILVGQPSEAYSIFQQELRRQFPNNVIVVMNLVNGSYGYLPPKHLYEKEVYPVWQTPFAEGALEILTAKALGKINCMIFER